MLFNYDIVHALPAIMDASVNSTMMTSSTHPGIAPFLPPRAPLSGSAGKVVAKSLVGSGVPLIVTVGTALFGDEPARVGLLPAERTENRDEVASSVPCVEFMKVRK